MTRQHPHEADAIADRAAYERGKRLRLALRMQAMGLELKREQLRRANPHADEQQIGAMLHQWLLDTADHPAPFFRKRKLKAASR